MLDRRIGTRMVVIGVCLLSSAAPLFGASPSMVISEFRTRGPNGASDEFVELYNLSTAAVNLGGWKLKGSGNTGVVATRATIATGTVVNPGCHYLLTSASGYSGSVAGDQTYATGITDDGGLAVTLPDDTIVDQVGMSGGSALKEGATLAPTTTNSNTSYERTPGGAQGSGDDSDDNAADFQLIAPSDPQNASSLCISLATATATQTSFPSLTPTLAATASPTETATETPSSTPTMTPTASPTATPTCTITPSGSPTQTQTDTATATATDTPSASPTATPSCTASDTPSAMPIDTAMDTPTEIPASTATSTQAETAAPTPSASPSPSQTATAAPTSSSTVTPTVTATFPMHDSVVLPIAPVTLHIPAAKGVASKVLRIKVRNADPKTEVPGHTVQLSAATDCPGADVIGLPDFGKGADSVLLAGGQSKTAKVLLTIYGSPIASFNRLTPYRCHVTFTAAAIPAANDPTAANNSITAEINIVDTGDTENSTPPPPHESFIKSVAPVTVTIGKHQSVVLKKVKFAVGNADYRPVLEKPGDMIHVSRSDGDCPSGSVSAGGFDADTKTDGDQAEVQVAGGAIRTGVLQLTIDGNQFPATINASAPTRCTATLTVSGPSGTLDPEPTNNTTVFTIDVIDKNDLP